jgi:methionyl-tRNA formyltransferase
MSRFRVCFLGTPPFAEAHLRALLNHPEFEVVGVVTQPDRPAGRKMQLTPSKVKITAVEKNMKVLTPENLRKDDMAMEEIKSWKADVAVVVAFGQILSQDFLDSFPFGAVNVHGSLLPKWRGAAPIQRALEAGDKVSGVSLQQMVKKLDAGPVIAEKRVELSESINATELYDLLEVKGCELLTEALPEYLRKEIVPKPQNESEVTVAKKIEKEESLLDWTLPAEKLHNRIRAFTMGPGTYVPFRGQRLKIHRSNVADASGGTAGTIAAINEKSLIVLTGSRGLSLLEVQPESKARMPISEFLKSANLKQGDLFA